MIGVRLSNFSDGTIGEPEQDANSALTELDKGLRSGKVGEQCEAIVRFPRLFEKYPFPILINSSFLKLADIFRVGNNFLRLWVLRVCQQSEKHLDKILNVDEFLRRIFSVLHSNDPVARALALRTLGAVAGIIPERQNVHHAIRRGLDSHDNVEVDAAIYATTQFAAHSNAFAISMCNKLSDMVECENTGAVRRAKLVQALCTVHGGAVRAHGVLKLLSSLLKRFPASSTVRAAIHAITSIANDTVVHVPDQVELLLSLAVNDARMSIRHTALKSLKKLAEHAAVWPAECIQALISTANARSDDITHTMLCLEVMQMLVSCPAICASAGAIESTVKGGIEPNLLRKYCSEAAMSVNLRVASTAADVLTRIVVYCYQENLPVEGTDLMLSLESLVIATGLPSSKPQSQIQPLRIVLRCLVQLCNAEPTLYAARTARVLGSQLKACNLYEQSESSYRRLVSILEGLCALGSMTYCPLSIKPAMPAVIEKLKEIGDNYKPPNPRDVEPMEIDNPTTAASSKPIEIDTALLLLCTIACQERAGVALTHTIKSDWEDLVMNALSPGNGWAWYGVARACLRYGHQQLAAKILKKLVAAAPSEAAQRWLSALHRAASADAKLIKEGVCGLQSASASWQLAGGAGGAGRGGGVCAAGCGGCGACTLLGASWMCARAAMLSAMARTATAARALCTQPPPAVAHHQVSRSAAARAGACAGALHRASIALADVAAKHAHIARTAFHADDNTLRHLHILQHTCNLMSQFLERICSANHQERQAIELTFSGKEMKPHNLEEKIMINVCNKIEEISSKLFDNPTTKPGISHRHMDAILSAVSACAGGAIWSRGVSSGGAGGAGGTRCTVGIRGPTQDHIPLTHHLALTVEGVLLPATRKKQPIKYEHRQVKGVQLTVTATPHPRNNEKNVELNNIQPVLTAVQTVTPIRDFFSAQQLVSVPTPGLYTVAVEAAFVDQKGELWNTGPRTSIVIKAHDDSVGKSNSQTTRGRF